MTIASGNIQYGVLYVVSSANIIYNGTIITAGNTFRGVIDVITYTGTGVVNEVLELKGLTVDYLQNGEDLEFPAETTKISGIAVEFALNDAEKIVNETTKILGMTVELVDYPFYCFTINEIRI